jgi:hypothetical protein
VRAAKKRLTGKTASLLAITRSAIEWACILALGAVVVLPLVDIALARILWSGLPQASSLADHSVPSPRARASRAAV